MALKRWHRASLTAAGMALAAAVALPPRPLPEPGEIGSIVFPVEPTWSYRNVFERTLSGTVYRLQALVRAARLADSLQAMAAQSRALHSADRALTVVYASPIPADTARLWLGMLERELALVPRGATRGIPVIVQVRQKVRRPNTSGIVRDWQWMRFVSPRPERPACFVDVQLADIGTRRAEQLGLITSDDRIGAPRTRVLGWCSLYARFGTPGARVGQWVGARVETYVWRQGPDLSSIIDVLRRGRGHQELATWWWEKLSGACSRDGGPCLRMVGLVSDPTDRWEGMSSVRKASLVAGLMLKDPGRFQEFWRSTEAPAMAIERAYGRPVGSIVADWRSGIVGGDPGEPAGFADLSAINLQIDAALYGPEPGGPRMPAGALLSSLGWAVLAIGLGILVAWRQQVR